MSGEAAQQVLDASVDLPGLSVCSATMTAEKPRNGSMYNSVVLAAGVPIWFHALQDGRYVALFQSHWLNATVGTGGPQSYTDHLEAGSCWVRVTPPGGGTVALGNIPTRIPGENLIINGAASRQEFLYTVGNLDGNALIQHHRISVEGMLLLQAEELMFAVPAPPDPEWRATHPLYPLGGVIFDRGCYIDDQHLVVIGVDSGGNLFMARRRWARIGQPDPTIRYTWEYRSAKGWLADFSTLEPIGLISVGPVSVAKFKDRLLLATVAHAPGKYAARVYQSRLTDPFGRWKLSANPVPLGTDGFPPSATPIAASFSGGGQLAEVESVLESVPAPLGGGGMLGGTIQIGDPTYLGGTLHFQSLNTNQPLPEGVVAQIPYVHSTRVISGAEESIDTVWGLWPVRSTV